MRTTFAGMGTVLAACSLGMLPVVAQAACTAMSTAQSRPVITAFMNRPVGLLERFPYGGAELADRLSVIVGSDVKGTLPSALEIIRSSNHNQKEAIGKALAFTHGGCLRHGDGRSAELVQTAVSRMTDTVVRSQFYALMAGAADSDNQKKDTTPAPGGRASLPVGRLPNPFAPQYQVDPNRPIPPIR